MKTKIVVDSSSNLYALSGVDFVCVPLKIVTDDGEYLDTAELDAVGMAQTLRSYKGKTGTSCPNVADRLSSTNTRAPSCSCRYSSAASWAAL